VIAVNHHNDSSALSVRSAVLRLPAALVRRQADNDRWHRGLPLIPLRITAQPTDPKPPTLRQQLLAGDGIEDDQAIEV